MTHDSYTQAHEALREQAPLVHCLTNSVVQEVTANVLLAVGAAPAMVSHPVEAAEFAEVADAVLVNVGNPHLDQLKAMDNALDTARRHHKVTVLDPVAVGGLSVRTEFARRVVEKRPTVIRANPSEILHLHAAVTGSTHEGGRGVDATDSVDSALTAARELAEYCGAVVAVSGATDVVVSPGRVTRIDGGDPLMAVTIGTGCALGAVVAAFVAAADSAHDATVAAHVAFATAAQRAAHRADGPGTFRQFWLDELYRLPAAGVACRITED
ncbi:hydroxyethylthiazole kinase [Corynebacterium yudongzhengii]|uniref:Hydroxyethylthiazole kinase n=1 Tax=Corynebacterium yudongzhengii TaxID=2080740 RepID=A0A2U1T5T5_9CORY|nr:hydroxyethylthiazole kinase [Corynebacterium yudongzhengii]AWB82618.1 hydroxyethylthiazole kinase [Corynebacterium yudongzhengii]PWC01352.1 hydroxyethylthiazole kinase [Corynebacterium yudongzhengii]